MTDEYLEYVKDNKRHYGPAPQEAPRVLTSEDGVRCVEEMTGRECGIVYEDGYIRVFRDAVEFPDGSLGTYIWVEQKGARNATAVLPLVGDRVLLEKNWRHAVHAWSLEIPRGFAEDGLSPWENAFREMTEETGAEPLSLLPLGRVRPDGGLLATEIAIYAARMPERTKFTNTDPHEAIAGFGLLSGEELFAAVKDGRITDSFTLSAVALAVAGGLV